MFHHASRQLLGPYCRWELYKPHHTLRMFNFLYLLPLFAEPVKRMVGLLSARESSNSDITGQVQVRYMPSFAKNKVI